MFNRERFDVVFGELMKRDVSKMGRLFLKGVNLIDSVL